MEWFEYNRKGKGVVKKVICEHDKIWGNDPKYVIIDDVGFGEVTVDVGNIRILKGKNK